MTLGEKLSKLRKEYNYTQEQLADILGVSRQSISKWESDIAYPETDKLIKMGKLFECSMDYLLNDDITEKQGIEPDVDMLIELADFYNVDIREIIDGERKSESMDNETKDTLKKVAEYATEESNKRKERLRTLLAGSTCLMLISYLLFGSEHKGRLNGIISEAICGDIMSFVCGLAAASLVLYALHCLGAFDKIGQWKENRKSKKH